MFAIFNNGSFVGFWSNKIGDVFFQLTCQKRGYNSPSLFWYNIQEKPEHFDFDENKNLLIKEKIVTIENEIEVVSYNTIETKQADPYFDNGIFYKAC